MLDDRDVLSKEIECWESFRYGLREENRLLFTKMLKECQKQEGEQFARAVNSKGEPFATESLFMVLILQQQRMINLLINNLSNMKKN
jgi:hypothetical protein